MSKTRKNLALAAKIRKIEKEGIRGKKVSHKQAIAVAISILKGHSTKKRKK